MITTGPPAQQHSQTRLELANELAFGGDVTLANSARQLAAWNEIHDPLTPITLTAWRNRFCHAARGCSGLTPQAGYALSVRGRPPGVTEENIRVENLPWFVPLRRRALRGRHRSHPADLDRKSVV